MNRTPIEWVKNPDGTQGYTWNPITGCLNGCEYCYARKLANGRLKSRYLANTTVSWRDKPFDLHPSINPFHPRFWEDRLAEPLRGNRQGKGIFPCDMSDLFGIGIPDEWTRRVMNIIKLTPENRYYLLTKQYQNLVKFSPFPGNCWPGVTATNTRMALEACLALGDIEASVRYLSIEPMLNSINMPVELLQTCRIRWLIIGGCTGSKKDMEELIKRYPDLTLMPWGKKWTAQPKIEWVEEIVDSAVKANVKVFMKDNLSKLYAGHFQHYQLRQELP